MRKWIKILMPVVVVAVGAMFPIVLTTGCKAENNIVEEETEQGGDVGSGGSSSGENDQKQDPVVPAKEEEKVVNKYKVVFNANGGKIVGNNVVDVVEDTLFKNVAKPEAIRDGFKFVGWNIADNWKIDANIQADAIWEEIQVEPEPEIEPEDPVEPIVDPIEEPEEPKMVAWDNETVDQYIQNRTFSLIEWNENEKEFVAGTGWILADATPDNLQDYKYFVATNLHVALGFEAFDGVFEFGNKRTQHFVNDGTETQWGLDPYEQDKYIDFFGGYVMDWNKNYDQYMIEGNNGLDFFIQEIDFTKDNIVQKYINNNNVDKWNRIVQNLDKLNQIQKEYGKINQFADINNIQGEKLYVGGFPVENGYTVYKQKEIDINKVAGYAQGEIEREIGDGQYVDIAAQLIIQEPVAIDWLGAGASGAMLVDQYNQIVGIYWGGFGADEEGKLMYPAFDLICQYM